MHQRIHISLAVTALALCGLTSFASGQEPAPLFTNYYTQGYANQATAQMYVTPVPVPPWVGHTYYTYQPLYPHEMMHHHSHRYHNYYDGGNGLNRTGVHYSSAPVITSMKMMMNSISIPRRY
jgi:hypothetical protein